MRTCGGSRPDRSARHDAHEQSHPSFSEEQRSDCLFQAMIHTLELFGVYLGKRLGLYRLGV